jgi:hypothetical protein
MFCCCHHVITKDCSCNASSVNFSDASFKTCHSQIQEDKPEKSKNKKIKLPFKVDSEGSGGSFKYKLKMRKDKFFASVGFAFSRCTCGIYTSYE